MTIGQNIKRLRTAKALSQEYVAIKLGVSRQAVSKWETDCAVPDTYNLIALAELFEVSVESIVSVEAERISDISVSEEEKKPEKKKNTDLLAPLISALIGIALVIIAYFGNRSMSSFPSVLDTLVLLPAILSSLWMLFYSPTELIDEKRSVKNILLKAIAYAVIAEILCAFCLVGYYLSELSYELLVYHFYYIWPLAVMQVNMLVMLEMAIMMPLLTGKSFGLALRIAFFLISILALVIVSVVLNLLIGSMALIDRCLIMGSATLASGAILAISSSCLKK